MVPRMNQSPARTDKAEATRRRIVDASAKLFAENGYRGTSLSDIIAASGSTKGGFYFHFASKAELASAVVMDAEEDFQADVAAAVSAYTRGADQLVALVGALTDAARDRPMAARIGQLCEELRSEPDIDRANLYPHDAWVALVTGLLQKAKAEGDLDPETDPQEAAVFAVSAFVGMVELIDQESEEAVARTHSHLQFTLRAIGLHTSVLAA
jgi:AcrR family transcriptional regulator